jgi:hypothetical protein
MGKTQTSTRGKGQPLEQRLYRMFVRALCRILTEGVECVDPATGRVALDEDGQVVRRPAGPAHLRVVVAFLRLARSLGKLDADRGAVQADQARRAFLRFKESAGELESDTAPADPADILGKVGT